MADKDTDDKKAPAEERELHISDLWRGHRREVLVGLVCCLGLVLLGGYVLYRATAPKPQTATPAASAEAGLIDMEKVLQAHPDYDKLQDLRQECHRLELETGDVSDIMSVQSPEVDSQPFDDSVWQKNAHEVIGKRAELERRERKLKQDYAKAIEPEYEARREAIEAQYQNEIVNLNLKIDNQKSMHNFRDDKAAMAQELADWEQERDDIQRERGKAIRALEEERLQDIADYVQRQIGPELASWQAQLPQLQAQQESEAARKQSEAQSRDSAAMEQQLQVAQSVQERLEKRQELQTKQNELQALEAKIYNDISGRAAKVAIIHHLTIIMANEQKDLLHLLPADTTAYMPVQLMPPASLDTVIGIDTIDVTDELVAEMQTLQPDD